MSVPEKIGNYILERQIGRGASSEVWLGRHEQLQDHLVAVKIFLSRESEALRRFEREAAIAARLRHPKIARLYDFGQAGPFLYTALEYVEGGALRQLLARRGRLPLEEAFAIFDQVAGALDYAHSLNVIHRDISPGNILVEERTGRALLTDFGIARDASRPVTTDMIMGTPGYVSPEHADSPASITHLSDIFVLGVVLYQMLSGELPWPASHGLPGKAAFTEPVPLRERGVRETPADVDRVLRTLLAVDPAHRYASAGAAAVELRRILERHQMPTQVLQGAAPALGKVAEAQMGGIEPNEVETVLGPDLVRGVIDRAHQRAEALRNPASIAELLDTWAAQDRLRRRPLLGRLARLHKVSSRNVYFYTLRVLYERRTVPEDDEEPDRGKDAFPLEPEVERWAVPLAEPKGFEDEAGGRLHLPGSTRVVACKGCMGKGLTICPRCAGSRRVYAPRPAGPTAAPGAVTATAAAAATTVPRRSAAAAPEAASEQILVPCPACDGRGGLVCERCEGVGRLIRRKAFHWSRKTRAMAAHDDLPALNEEWLSRACKAELVYNERQKGGMRPEWSLVGPVAGLITKAEARCDDENRVALAELTVGLIPVTEIVFDLGKPGEGGLYKLAIYGFEQLIPPDWRFFNWERVILLCLVVFLSVLVVVLLVFAFLG